MSNNEEFIDIDYILKKSYFLNEAKEDNFLGKIITSGSDTLYVFNHPILEMDYKGLADLCYWLKLGLMWIEFEIYYKLSDDNEFEEHPINHIKMLLRVFNFAQTPEILDEIPDIINVEHAECYIIGNKLYENLIKTLQHNRIPYQINTYKTIDCDYLIAYDDIPDNLEDE